MRTLLIFLIFSSFCFGQQEFVAKIINEDGSSGSCVAIKKLQDYSGGHINVLATANHVVDGSQKFVVEYQDGQRCKSGFFSVADKDNDISLIVAWSPKEVPICELELNPNGQLSICGYPYGFLQKQEGNFLKKFENSIYSDIITMPGYSGGGLFKGKKLVGIISGGWFWIKERNSEKKATWPLKCGSSDVIINLLNEINKKNYKW